MAYQIILFTDMIESVYHIKALGAYSLASSLRASGYSTLVIDHFSRYVRDPKLLNEVIRHSVGKETILIGFSGTFFSNKFPDEVEFNNWQNYRNAQTDFYCTGEKQISLMQKLLRSRYPQIRFVYGGHPAQQEHELLSKSVKLDYIVKGYAESGIFAIIDHINKQQPVPGYMINNTMVVDSTGLNKDFELRNHLVQYQPHDVILPNEVLSLETSRGCMYNCSFCSFPLRGRKRDDLSYHVHEDLLYQYFMNNYHNHGVTNYTIVDDTFNETTDKLRKFNQVVKRTKLPLQFMTWIRLDLMGHDMEQLDLLLDSGVRSVWFGIESLNDTALKSIQKQYTGEFAMQTLAKIRQRAGPDFRIYSTFIIGLPGDSEQSIAEWMSWVIDQSPIDCIDVIPLHIHADQINWSASFSKQPKKFGYTMIKKEQKFTHEWQTKQMTSERAKELAKHYNDIIWQSSRNRLACFDLFGIMNHGYTFDELKDIPIDQLPFDEIVKRGQQLFVQYHNELIKQITI